MNTHRLQTRSAYTLIQLMVAVAIISATTVAVFPNLNTRAQDILVNKAMIELQRLMEASVIYYGDNNVYPTSIDDLVDARLMPDIPDELGGNVNAWGKPYTFSTVDTNFFITTDTKKNANAKKLSRLLPNALQSSSTPSQIALSTTAVDKVKAPHNGMLLVDIENVRLRKVTGSVTEKFYTVPQSKIDELNATCGFFDRDPDFFPAMTGFTIGSMIGGSYTSQGLSEPYVPAMMRSIHVVKARSGNTWTASIDADIIEWVGMARDYYASANMIYVCREEGWTPPPISGEGVGLGGTIIDIADEIGDIFGGFTFP